ncbi:CsbD family protein [Streptomyces sp. NPDC002994]|uniref:CsbD family protein n=1 Tax=Streptomyces sp. NPDC002994 TaxID=3154441 RepID=UPI0033A20EC9
MSVVKEQKARAKAEQAKGKVKKTTGRSVGNESLEGKGRGEQVKGDARQVKEKIKDMFKR